MAKKIERLKHGWIQPALSPLDSPGATPSTFLTPLTLPPEVEVVLVSDAATLESACRRAKQGGVVGASESKLCRGKTNYYISCNMLQPSRFRMSVIDTSHRTSLNQNYPCIYTRSKVTSKSVPPFHVLEYVAYFLRHFSDADCFLWTTYLIGIIQQLL